VNTDTTAAERRAKAINVNYRKRFKKLDEVFASDVVGDGTTGIMGPFEAAHGRFFTGQVIPLVVGAFGDVNEALEKVLKRVATKVAAAAAETDGLTISPLINTDLTAIDDSSGVRTQSYNCPPHIKYTKHLLYVRSGSSMSMKWMRGLIITRRLGSLIPTLTVKILQPVFNRLAMARQ
jgi:hypothetical protein